LSKEWFSIITTMRWSNGMLASTVPAGWSGNGRLPGCRVGGGTTPVPIRRAGGWGFGVERTFALSLLVEGRDGDVRPAQTVEIELHELGVLKLERVGLACGAGDGLDPKRGVDLDRIGVATGGFDASARNAVLAVPPPLMGAWFVDT
jgi:hypothetical protein